MTRMETPSAFTQPTAPRMSAWRRAMKAAKRWLYWFHRWLGVVTCLFCVMWFVSGLVMLYVPFPSWSDAERVAALPAIDVSKVRVTPDDALGKAALPAMPGTFRLEMFAGEPVYRMTAGNRSVAVSAATGTPLQAITETQAAEHLAAVCPSLRPTFVSVVDADQWTPTKRFDPHRPLYRFALNDEAGTAVYVSSKTGEIVQNATHAERAWNWVGAVPHWIYFTPIRRDQDLWRQVILWSSGPLVIGAISGVWIGILRLRKKKAARPATSVSPYRGWMLWHHLAGLLGGLFLTTWIFSGWLSVNPFQWFARTQLSDTQRTAYAGWTPDSKIGMQLSTLNALPQASDISFAWLGGRPLMLAKRATDATLLDPASGSTVTLADRDLTAAAQRLYTDSRIVQSQRIDQETLYWYSHHNKRPLPALAVSFNDKSATTIYLDPATGTIAGLSDRSSRTYRWLFNFLHDYDLPVLLRNEPARQILIWLLSLAGLVISISGVVISWRTLKRQLP